MKEIKKCTDCKWFVPDRDHGEFSICRAPQNLDTKGDTSLEVGIEFRQELKMSSAKLQREESLFWAWLFDCCGRSGRWWQKKD